ncbi:MAG: methyltransferase domain-containing protein [Anaerolineae bacterium]|nr:methyltransferase domain-containing protein [Anaerolineae bacterium]
MIDYQTIIEAALRLPNPLTEAHLRRLAQAAQVRPATRLLDVACGGGELLNSWALWYEVNGTGVDAAEAAIHLAEQRANELKVWAQVQYTVSEALDFPQSFHQYHIVSHLGLAAWGDQLGEALNTLRAALRDNEDGVLLIGETFWRKPPSAEACAALGLPANTLRSLDEVATQLLAHDVELLDMIVPTPEDWDAFMSAQWRAISDWLPACEDVALANRVRTQWQQSQLSYLRYERELIGWAAFVLRAAGQRVAPPPPEFDWQQRG